jgi:uncharacterized protein (DUF2235 family)
MPELNRNIVICCDGTANEPKARGATNVFELVRLLRAQPDQLVYYDPGLGTESAPGAQTRIAKTTTKVLGLAFGYGLKKNIGDAYTYLMDHYQPGDRIFMFGFSRGAYTVRALAGTLHTVGLLEQGSGNLLYYAIKKYTQQGKREWADIGAFKGTLCRQISDSSPRFSVPIHFLGVWDTVKSVGLFRGSVILPYTQLLPNVASARHAVALDEKRSKYRPNLWTATGSPEGDLQTMWFTGVHADVGGGYTDTERGLADIALGWMLDGAEQHGLRVDREKLRTASQKRIEKVKQGLRKAHGSDDEAARREYERVHNPLIPFWWVLGWWRRKLPDRAWIHESTLHRIAADPKLSDRSPLAVLRRLGDKTVHLEDALLLVRHREAVLIQHLTPGELAYFKTAGLSDEPEVVLRGLRFAGIELWTKKLERHLESGSIELSENSRQKAGELLDQCRDAVVRDEIKGDQGAFAHLESLLRMTSLKNTEQERAARQEIIDSAPYLLESLAEHPSVGG